VVRPESSPIVRLSTRDIAPADRLNYANWILSVADGAAPTEVSAGDPTEFEGSDRVRAASGHHC
jgi:hypothetical protein